MQTIYRIYLNHAIQGPYDIDELLKCENLSKETLVCEVGEMEWQSVGECSSIQVQLANNPMKWGQVQQTLLNTSAFTPSIRNIRKVSNSGDYGRSESLKATMRKSAPKTEPEKKGLLGWLSSVVK